MTKENEITEERRTLDPPGPNGGVVSIAYYRDGDGNPVDKAKAVEVEIVELDGEGNEVGRTYAELGGGGGGEG